MSSSGPNDFPRQVADGKVPGFGIDPDSHLLKWNWVEATRARTGDKLIYTGTNGHDSDLERANRYLKVGNTYTLATKDVGGWSSSFVLKEFPNVWFNSVHFATSRIES